MVLPVSEYAKQDANIIVQLKVIFFLCCVIDLFAQPSEGDDGLFGSEGSPFTKKGGLFSGGGGLFDDEHQVQLYHI